MPGAMENKEPSILTIVDEILHDRSSNKAHRFTKTYPAFAASYPTLMTMCCDARTDAQGENIRTLASFMLAQLNGLNQGQTTGENASRAVADELNRRYVDPLIDGSAHTSSAIPSESE